MAEKVIKVGMMGADVSGLHETLSSHGMTIPESETGRGFFGPATRNAVLEIQKRNQLPATGQVDSATASALLTEPSAKASLSSASAAALSPGTMAGAASVGALAQPSASAPFRFNRWRTFCLGNLSPEPA